MTNPNDAVGTNAAYGTRTSVNAFNDFTQLVNGRGVLSGWDVVPKTGMTVEVGGIAGTRDVAIAEDNLGNRTTVNNKSNSPIEITLEAASSSSNRYDAIVVYVNNPAQADDETPDAPSVCGIIAVQGGSTGVSEAQIRTAISADGGTGSVAYYAVLADIFIAANTTTITGSNITQEHIAISASDIADNEILYRMINWAFTTGETDGDFTRVSFGHIHILWKGYSSGQTSGAWVDIGTVNSDVKTGDYIMGMWRAGFGNSADCCSRSTQINSSTGLIKAQIVSPGGANSGTFCAIIYK